MSLVDEGGRRVQLGERVGPRGGEGEIFRVAGDPGSVAKIYHQPPEALKTQKLQRLRALADPGLQKVAAWPTRLLYREGSTDLKGFVMPFQAGRRIEQLYSPRDRLREFPKAGWDFLLHVARNCAAAFETLHEHGVVMADVNEGNLIVTDQGLVRLIDCDSYQVPDSSGRILTCDVGVALWTPPELQGRPLSGVVRTPDHDRFGLALLIFHLLFMGRHPYAGVPVAGDDDDQLEGAIARYRYAFGANHLQLGVRPPAHLLTPAAMPTTVAGLFERAFLPAPPAMVGRARPSGREWAEVLKLPLRRCTSNSLHSYPETAGDCPWCRIYRGGGPQFFAVVVLEITTPAVQVDELWKPIAARQGGGLRIKDFTALSSSSFNPTPLPAGLSKSRKEFYAGWVLVVFALGLLFIAPSLVLTALIFGVPGVLMLMGGKTNTAYGKEIERRRNAVQQLSRSLHESQQAVLKVQGDYRRVLAERFSVLEGAYRRHRNLASERQVEVQKLDANKREVQLRAFLDRHLISRARVPGVGDVRKATLKAFGIETALDITANLRVPGIGPTYQRALFSWRLSVEQKFVYDPRAPLPQSELNQLEQRFRDIRLQIESQLRAGPMELDRLTGQAKEALNRIEETIPALIVAHKQANADASLV